MQSGRAEADLRTSRSAGRSTRSALDASIRVFAVAVVVVALIRIIDLKFLEDTFWFLEETFWLLYETFWFL